MTLLIGITLELKNLVRANYGLMNGYLGSKSKNDKDNESDNGQSGKDVDSFKAQIAHEEATKAMTDEEKELADLFLKPFGILPSVDSISLVLQIAAVSGNEVLKSNRKA